MGKPNLFIFNSKEALIQHTLECILERAQDAIAQRNRFTIALAGGSTPKPLYEKLAQTHQDWEKWHIFWGDERFVPNTHADSNERMAREAWLDQIEIPPRNIHPLKTDFESPEQAAAVNETELQEFWQLSPEQWPQFDVILLGMGDDGHTASLFPQTPALQVCDRWVTVGMKDNTPRLTLTIPILNQAHSVMFLVAGRNKNKILTDIFTEKTQPTPYPVELIHPNGELLWMLDAEAGAGLQ